MRDLYWLTGEQWFGIGGIVLLALDEWLHISGRDQPDLVPDRHKLPCPMVRPAARFHRDQTARLLPNKVQQLAPAQHWLNICFTLAFTPCAWKTAFAISNPIVITSDTEASLSDARHLHSGTPGPSGASPHPLWASMVESIPCAASERPNNGESRARPSPETVSDYLGHVTDICDFNEPRMSTNLGCFPHREAPVLSAIPERSTPPSVLRKVGRRSRQALRSRRR